MQELLSKAKMYKAKQLTTTNSDMQTELDSTQPFTIIYHYAFCALDRRHLWWAWLSRTTRYHEHKPVSLDTSVVYQTFPSASCFKGSNRTWNWVINFYKTLTPLVSPVVIGIIYFSDVFSVSKCLFSSSFSLVSISSPRSSERMRACGPLQMLIEEPESSTKTTERLGRSRGII